MWRRSKPEKNFSVKTKYLSDKQDDRGTSMVTVVISFALLLLLVTCYFRIYRLAGEMMMSSKDMLTNNSQLIRAYYLGETVNQVVADHVSISFSGENGSFCVEGTLNRADKQGLNGTIYYFSEDEKEPGEAWQE